MADAWTTEAARTEGTSLPHTPEPAEPPRPPLPQPEDDGSVESRQTHPNRVPSERLISTEREDSIYAHETENPLLPHHHPRRMSGLAPPEAGPHHPTAAPEDPFARELPPMPGLGLKRMGSSAGRSGSISQPTLHEVMFQQKSTHRSSIELRMVSSMRKSSTDVERAGSLNEDPFALAIPRTASVASSQGVQSGLQVVTVPVPGQGSDRAPSQQGFTSEERHAAESNEELFLPNMQREQFIPVRVARDKIKQVLSEMAHMRSMHLAALDTMEKQQAFLKAQLESATAAYVKKLTTDYNNRVTALEAEYKRRLENLNSSAMGSLKRDLADAKLKIEQMERNALERIQTREKELAQEQSIFLARLEHARSENAKLAHEVEERAQAAGLLQERIAELEAKLGEADSANPDADRVAQLESKLRAAEHNREVSETQRDAIEQKAIRLQEEVHQLRESASETEALRAEVAELRAKLAATS